MRPASVPLEATPFITDKITAPNFALSFPTCLSRKSWFRLLKIVFFEFQKSGINCFPFLPPPPSLQLPSVATKRNDLEFCYRNFSATNGFKTDCEGGLAASVSGAIAFRRWNPKPLQPLPNFPSSTMMKPFRQRWTSFEIIKKLPYAFAPNCIIKTLLPSLKVRAKLPGFALDLVSFMWVVRFG